MYHETAPGVEMFWLHFLSQCNQEFSISIFTTIDQISFLWIEAHYLGMDFPAILSYPHQQFHCLSSTKLSDQRH